MTAECERWIDPGQIICKKSFELKLFPPFVVLFFWFQFLVFPFVVSLSMSFFRACLVQVSSLSASLTSLFPALFLYPNLPPLLLPLPQIKSTVATFPAQLFGFRRPLPILQVSLFAPSSRQNANTHQSAIV